jgi:hypothetical protein
MSIYHRQYKFRGNSEMKAIPGIIIPDSSTDKLLFTNKEPLDLTS